MRRIRKSTAAQDQQHPPAAAPAQHKQQQHHTAQQHRPKQQAQLPPWMLQQQAEAEAAAASGGRPVKAYKAVSKGDLLLPGGPAWSGLRRHVVAAGSDPSLPTLDCIVVVEGDNDQQAVGRAVNAPVSTEGGGDTAASLILSDQNRLRHVVHANLCSVHGWLSPGCCLGAIHMIPRH